MSTILFTTLQKENICGWDFRQFGIINFDNVNWRPWRVSKLTFRALALRQSDPGTQVFGLLIVKFECLSITHGLFSANRNNDVLILHVSNLTNTLVFQHHLLMLSFFMAKIND